MTQNDQFTNLNDQAKFEFFNNLIIKKFQSFADLDIWTLFGDWSLVIGHFVGASA